MVWKIRGADRETGREVQVMIEADTESAAAEAANGQRIFVETIEPYDSQAVRYDELTRAANSINVASGILNALGAVSLFGLLASILAIVETVTDDGRYLTICVAAAFSSATWSAVCFLAAAFFRLLTHTSLAIRDIAATRQHLTNV